MTQVVFVWSVSISIPVTARLPEALSAGIQGGAAFICLKAGLKEKPAILEEFVRPVSFPPEWFCQWNSSEAGYTIYS
ncbi:MAG: hypothetical protein LBH57_09950 [Treponema sp.]|jgi:hypothetical protein|nr:hypothetical protein [Treponema sp.]